MCKWKVRARKGSTTMPSDEENMIDQHLAELQLLNSAAVVDGAARMNGNSASGELSMTKSNGHPAAAPGDEETMGEEEKTSRHGASNADQLSKNKLSRRVSHIDSLSPEVVRALQSTFGGKLDEIRSRFGPITPSPPPTRPPPRIPTPLPTPPSSPPMPHSPPEKHTWVERVASPLRPPSPPEKCTLVEKLVSPPWPPSPPEKRTSVEKLVSPPWPPSPPEKRTSVEKLASPPWPPSPPEKRTSVEKLASPPWPPSPPEKLILVEKLASPPRPPSPPEKLTLVEKHASPPRPPSPPEKLILVEKLASPPRPPSPPEKLTLVEKHASPPRPPSPPEKLTLVERLAGKEGANMLIAYFSAIFLSGFILLATEEDDADGNIDSEEDFCRVVGIESGCARLFGYILPVVLTASFFTVALVFFVFDVSFSFLNILTAAKVFFFETKKNKSTLISGEYQDDGRNGWTRPTGARLVVLFVSDLGFIVVSSAFLWMSKISTMDPLHAICEWRLQLLWMVGLLVMDVVILLSAVKSFSDPGISDESIHTAAKRVAIILCVLLACTAAINQNSAPDSKELGPCARRTPPDNPIQTFEPLQNEVLLPKCAGNDGPELLQCEWRPQSREKKVRHLDWCEANQPSCDWPRVKQIQLYERKDVCRIDLPQCDWPFMKQIQPYENKDRCEAVDLVKCQWPWVKQIHLYEHDERCQPKDVTLQQCDWPWLKQIQLFEAQDRCPLKNPDECEWPWVKQIQLLERKDSSAPLRCLSRKAGNYTL